jgi:uncharacterized protein YxeA
MKKILIIIAVILLIAISFIERDWINEHFGYDLITNTK